MSKATANFPLASTWSQDDWWFASRCMLVSSVVFFIMAALIYEFKPQSLAVIQSAPSVFFAGSLLTFALMVQCGAVLAPIAWFVLGAGIYFGLGSLASGLRVHAYSEQLFRGDNLYLTVANLLNAFSVLIIVTVAHFFLKMSKSIGSTQSDTTIARDEWLLKIFPYVLPVAAIGVGLGFVFFPTAESLLVRSLLGKIRLFITASFLMMAMLWPRLGWSLKAVALLVFVLEIFYGLVEFGKYQIVCALLALILGIWLIRKTWKAVFLAIAGMVLVFWVINPLITLGRAHIAYDAQKNTVATRVEILQDAALAIFNFKEDYLTTTAGGNAHINLKEMNMPSERVRAVGRRFEVVSVQAYLINEYNSGRPGNTLSNFWLTFIPRMIWSEKPSLTQLGGDLHKKYYNDTDQRSSALAPSYSAEAYWNFGISGVLLVSVLMGLAIGWLTRYSFLAVLGERPEYFLIAFPVAIWACFVEAWLVTSYLGEFVIFTYMLIIVRTLMKCHYYLNNKKA